MIESKNTQESWNGKLIARAYKNPAKYILKLKEMGCEPKVMLDFSGILLEALNELSTNGFFDSVEVNGEIVGNIIKIYKKVLEKFPESIEFAGTAYAHCYFPVTPEADWYWQIEEWRNVFSKIFGKSKLKRIKGFWLPEMGVPGYGDKLEKLIRTLKEFDYEWIILPIFAVKNYEKMSYEKRISIVSKPHLIEINGESIIAVFSAPYYFIDQQAGTTAEYIYSQCLRAKKFSGKKPALVITASDGENGNVMMNEFFPQTFTDFFCRKADEKVSSITVSEFLKQYYEGEKLDKVELKLIGASWVGGHERWIWGERRAKMIRKISEISKKVHESKNEKAKKLLLLAETSCYVYWGIDWWFDQGKKILKNIDLILQNKNSIK